MYSIFGIDIESFNPNVWFAFTNKITPLSNNEPHVHECVELVYILSGQCSYIVDKTKYVMKKGDLLIMNPNVLHNRIKDPDGRGEVQFLGFNNINIENQIPGNILKDISSLLITLSDSIDFGKCCTELGLVQSKHEFAANLIIKAIAMKMIVYVMQALHPDTIVATPNIAFKVKERNNTVKFISKYMDKNYMHDISLDKIARSIYLSPVYVSKLFKDELNESPINHLIKIRLRKASELLKQNKMSIKEISSAVGYKDSFYFSKLFKKYYGTAPSKYID